jgi:AraC family transcriptional regulator of adaptative response / DNA-3-methyladenine glycosylase II
VPSHTIHLPCSTRYDWTAALRFFAARAIDGIEQVDSGVYRRTVRIGGATGVLEVGTDAAQRGLSARLQVTDGVIDQADVTARLRRMFDLDADLPVINAHLSQDPLMSPLVAARPAMRVFGGWAPFEVAIRTVNGQQVSVERARHLNGELARRCDAAPATTCGTSLRRPFPAPQEVMDADLAGMGMPGVRVAALKAIASAAIMDPELFAIGLSLDETIARLRTIKGIGEWTAHYIAMRACRQLDAFPASDVGLLRGAVNRDGSRPTAAALLTRAEAWRPWRAYAAHHLWNVDSAASNGVRALVSDATVDA